MPGILGYKSYRYGFMTLDGIIYHWHYTERNDGDDINYAAKCPPFCFRRLLVLQCSAPFYLRLSTGRRLSPPEPI